MRDEYETPLNVNVPNLKLKKVKRNTTESIRDACVLTESRSIEAGYFYVTYKKLQLTMNLIQLSKHNKNEEIKRTILRSMKQIQTFQPEVILLYTNNENTELILQQVMIQVCVGMFVECLSFILYSRFMQINFHMANLTSLLA